MWYLCIQNNNRLFIKIPANMVCTSICTSRKVNIFAHLSLQSNTNSDWMESDCEQIMSSSLMNSSWSWFWFWLDYSRTWKGFDLNVSCGCLLNGEPLLQSQAFNRLFPVSPESNCIYLPIISHQSLCPWNDKYTTKAVYRCSNGEPESHWLCRFLR